ncbi:alpha/beta hydrolase [Sinomicrobium soli]|uniref:alpha/beta hydrolase n=1 Tax=Sinomicrobium sp. N-1-3-6 TaxID=2219864 RepID=UPI000DCC0AF6|nr:alpha/beta hydrolase-fold protein [Sinomicrobium sp. N-1-3-6]RAV29673.1 esterase [Sinomicrobium sp. N-1-3-6]
MKNILPSCCFLILFPVLLSAQYKKIRFPSKKLEQDRTVYLHVPEDHDPSRKYPLILVLDGDYLFETVMAASRFFSYNDQMPQSIIAGIAQEGHRLSDCNYNEDTGFPAGKGNAFFEFISEELLPSLSQKYKLADFKVIVGHGLTANFTNYFLFKDKPLFDAYIALEPSFAPNVDQYLLSRLETLSSARFYYLVAAEKNRDPRTATAIDELHGQLSAIGNKKLHYHYKQVPGADNYTVALEGIAHSLFHLFTPYHPISPEAYREELLTYEKAPLFSYLEEKYRSAEETFGISKDVRLNDIMAVYSACLEKEDIPSLEQLAKLGKKTFPDTALGFFFEAEAHEKTGETKKALRTYEKAFVMKEIDFMTKDLIQERIFAIKKDMGW